MICGGYHADYLLCPGHRDGVCRNKTLLPRGVAAKLLLGAISERILRNQSWTDAIHRSAVSRWRVLCADRPGEAEQLRKQIADLDRIVGRLVDQYELTDDPDPAIRLRHSERRQERERCVKQLDTLERAVQSRPLEPTLDSIRDQLVRLDEVLQGDAPLANEALHRLLGEPIELKLVHRPGRARPHWEGTFTLTTSPFQPGTHAAGRDGAGSSELPQSDDDLKPPKDCRWSFRGLAIMALLWVWSEEATLTSRFAAVLEGACRLWPRELQGAISYQAFLKRLVRWTESLMVPLKQALRGRLRRSLSAHWQIAGRCVFGADDS